MITPDEDILVGVEVTVATPPLVVNEKSLTVKGPDCEIPLYTVVLKETSTESFVLDIAIFFMYGSTLLLSDTVLFDCDPVI